MACGVIGISSLTCAGGGGGFRWREQRNRTLSKTALKHLKKTHKCVSCFCSPVKPTASSPEQVATGPIAAAINTQVALTQRH